MVVFTCNGCGESLKKGKVEKHLTICRNCKSLSCIDCGKDFCGEDYKSHIKCLTEDEKYGGKAFEAKASKGDLKQQQWIERIQELLKKPNISDSIRNILNQISTFDNVPRKQLKFQNWMKNSLRIVNPAVQDQVWEIFKEATNNQQKGNTNNNAPEPSNAPVVESKSESSAATEGTKKKSKQERKEERQKMNKKEKKDLKLEEQLQNGTKKKGKKRKMEDDESNKGGNDEANDEEATRKKKKKQREHEGEGVQKEAPQEKKKPNDSEALQEEEADKNGTNENVEEDSGKSGKFNWKGTIKALLRLAPDNEVPIKKLRKKVIAQYYLITSEQHRSPEELLATFNKKIQNNPKFRVLKEKVKLVK